MIEAFLFLSCALSLAVLVFLVWVDKRVMQIESQINAINECLGFAYDNVGGLLKRVKSLENRMGE